MLFNSYLFIFVFLPVVLCGFYLIKWPRAQLFVLLCSSVFFYAYWSRKYVFFLLLTVFVDFYVAKAIFNTPEPRRKKLLLITSMTLNLSILGFFKYYNLLIGTFNSLFHLVTQGHDLFPVLNIVLPIGISFYTFQSMSYVIDVYRGVSDAHANLLSFAGYVTLFPHQISGPLVRHNKIVPQLENQNTYKFHSENFWKGCTFFVFGLAKKVLIADLLAQIVAPLVTNMPMASNLEALLAMLGYTMQLYFDFSGYSDMAVGLGYMMNIEFPQNFNSPYKSLSITEFWKRWHITLSSWLKDYLYISLGGNRYGISKTYRNLLLTMVIGGLWHGGSWTFAVWGLFHGLLLASERFCRDHKLEVIHARTTKWIFTFILINIGWIFFRAPDFSVAFLWLQKVFFLNHKVTWDTLFMPPRYSGRFYPVLAIAIIASLFTKNMWKRTFNPTLKHALTLGFLFALCLMFMGQESPFLYFQF